MNQMPSCCPAQGVEFLPINDEGLLFDQNGQRLFHLNAVATFIWSCLDQGHDIEDIAQATGQAMRVKHVRARQYVLDMLKTWRVTGLLQGGCHFPSPERAGGSLDEISLEVSDEDLQQPVIPARQHYQFLDSVFSLGFGSPLLRELVDPTFQHLRTQAEAKDLLYLNIIYTRHRFTVLHGNAVIGRCATSRELGPLLHGLLGLLAIRRYEYLLAIHASCLGRSGNALVMPGRSGSGKTTVTAALMAAGWEYMSDDTALLLPQTLACVGAPYALTIKEGAWPILRRYYPDIDRAPIHLRSDERLVRYLCPTGHDFSKPRPLRWVGFPHRSTTATSSMRLLDQIEGLYRMLEHCCAIPRFLSSDDIQLLVDWSAGTRFFEFAITDIDEAVAQVDAMTGTERDAPGIPLPTSDDSRESLATLHTSLIHGPGNGRHI
jgi:hypothetical protein